MSRDEALEYLSYLIKDEETYAPSAIVRIVLIQVKVEAFEKAWTDAVFFIKKSCWEEFCAVVGLTSDNPARKARYDEFKETLFREIQAYWDGFVRGLEKK